MSYQRIKVLIWGKTYPELSTKYVETVCTGGLREDGTPIRLYPVPLRYLATGQQYQLYDWIEVPVEKSKSDPRPESFKVASDKIVRVGHIGTERATWRSRREHIFRNPSWHFASIADLKAVQSRDGRSMGLVAPGKVEDVKLIQRTDRERREYDDQMEKVHEQQDAFRPEYKELEFVPYEVRLLWRCLGPCGECSRRPHDMKALDWGLLELGRRDGWDKARQKLADLSNLSTHDFRLFMGNFRLHPQTFGIIGLWYPPKRGQLELL